MTKLIKPRTTTITLTVTHNPDAKPQAMAETATDALFENHPGVRKVEYDDGTEVAHVE